MNLRGQCYHLQIFHCIYGLKQLELHVLHKIVHIKIRDFLLPLMRSWTIETLKFIFFHVFGSRFFLFNSKEHRNKFDFKADEGVSLGYSLTSEAYRVLKKELNKIKESYFVNFDAKFVNSSQWKPIIQCGEIFPSSC